MGFFVQPRCKGTIEGRCVCSQDIGTTVTMLQVVRAWHVDHMVPAEQVASRIACGSRALRAQPRGASSVVITLRNGKTEPWG